MLIVYVVVLMLAFGAGSMTYVYAWRGNVRWGSASEYLRKSWPVFQPLNCLLYLFTRAYARKPIADANDFEGLDEIRRNWQVIRDEALALHCGNHFENARCAGSPGSYDVGFRTFFKYGWSKFYVNWYGYTHESARRLCPKTVEILSKIPSVNGAMFSVLPPGGQLTRHCDPMAASLRYHIGLATPNDDRCYIDVDGQQHSWRDGQTLIFDETYLHFARNDSEAQRVILMCDIERPMSWPGRVFNLFYKLLMKATVVPNDETDRRGFANRIYSTISPLLARSKQLKVSNPPAYKALKYSVNSVLLVLLLAVIAALLSLFQGMFSWMMQTELLETALLMRREGAQPQPA